MKQRLLIVQNRPTQFDMPLYKQMWESGDWDLMVIYSDADRRDVMDSELGRSPRWDHVPAEADRGIYLNAAQRKNVKSLVEQIGAYEPDLVVLCGYYPRLHAQLVGPLKRRGLNVGLRSDNTLTHSSFLGWKGLVKRVLLPFWLARYDTWHPVGSLARQYLEKISLRERPVYPFPYAVDVDWFEKQSAQFSSERDEHRARLGLSPDHFVVLGIMKWHPREDPLTLLRAFLALHDRHRNARLVLIGDGPLRDEVMATAREIGDAVLLPGYQPYSKLPMFYAVSDVFVHPPVDEPWGVSVQEALACGLPVVVAENVGARFDLLLDSVTGWTFPEGDDVALLGRLEGLARDRVLLERMRAAANTNAHTMDYDFSQAQFGAAIAEVPHPH